MVRGLDCKVTLHEHADFSGWVSGPFSEGDFNLGTLQANGFENDAMSSLRVYKEKPLEFLPEPEPLEEVVEEPEPEPEPEPKLTTDFVMPDYGGDECVVVVYQNADFSGWHAVFGEGDYDYDSFTSD